MPSRYKNRKAVWDPRSNTYLIYFEKNGEWNLLVDQNSVAIGVDPKDPDFKYKILNHLKADEEEISWNPTPKEKTYTYGKGKNRKEYTIKQLEKLYNEGVKKEWFTEKTFEEFMQNQGFIKKLP